MLDTASAIVIEEDMFWNLVSTMEFSIQSSVQDPLSFRIEVLEGERAAEAERRFRLRVWRYETFRLLPLNAVARGELFDHTCLVLDDMFDGLEVTGSSPEDAFIICRNKIFMQLGVVD